MKNTSLTIVGSGIKFKSHLTTEAEAYIKQSDKVLFLVNEPAMQLWIKANNPNAESLDPLYTKHRLRIDCYQGITDYILKTLKEGLHLCVVLYGHPTVFAKPALDAAIQASEEGFDVRVLPGISAEDCLFADLMIDPGRYGCQSFETTDLLVHRRQFDPRSHLILWQVGIIGALDHPRSHDNTKGAQALVRYLSQHYALEHKVFLYEAAQYPHFMPKIEKLPLCDLPQVEISRIATLYVPPVAKAPVDNEALEELGIALEDLK